MNTQIIAVVFSAVLAGMLLSYFIVRLNVRLTHWFFVKSLWEHELVELCRAVTPVQKFRNLEDLASALLIEISTGRRHHTGLIFGILEKAEIQKMSNAHEIMTSFARQFLYCFEKRWLLTDPGEIEILLANYNEANFGSIEPEMKSRLVSGMAEAILRSLMAITKRREVSDWDVTALRWVLGKCKDYPFKEETFQKLSVIYEEIIILRDISERAPEKFATDLL